MTDKIHPAEISQIYVGIYNIKWYFSSRLEKDETFQLARTTFLYHVEIFLALSCTSEQKYECRDMIIFGGTIYINMIFLTFTYSHTPIDKHFMNFLTISRRFDFIWTNIHLLRRNFLKHFSIIFFFLEYFSPFVSALFWKFAWVTGVSRCFEKYYFQNFGIFVKFLLNFGCMYLSKISKKL